MNWNQREFIATNPERYAVKRIGQEYDVAKHFVKACLKNGWMISVHDGEAYPLSKSTDLDAILDAMATTDEDVLLVRNGDTIIGRAWFTYGNSAPEVLGDHSVADDKFTAVCDETIKWARKFDG